MNGNEATLVVASDDGDERQYISHTHIIKFDLPS